MPHNDDSTKQFAGPHAGKAAAALQRHDKTGSAVQAAAESGRQVSPCNDSFYTPGEEAAISRAKVSSRLFMCTYGRGRQPYEIDLSHYENSEPIEKCKKKKRNMK